MASVVGKSIGTYEVEGELGSGGMGVVLLARQISALSGGQPPLRRGAHCTAVGLTARCGRPAL